MVVVVFVLFILVSLIAFSISLLYDKKDDNKIKII